VAYTDHELGRLWSALEARGGLDRSVVAVTSDHGEEFGEHGHFGHVALHHETLHVPLLLRFPDREWAGLRVGDRIELAGLPRTLLDAAGVEGLTASPNGGLLDGLRSARVGGRTCLAETTEHLYQGLAAGRKLPWRRALRRDGRCLLSTVEAGAGGGVEAERLEHYSLVSDPGELAPLAPGESAMPWAAVRADTEALARHLGADDALRRRLLAGEAGVFEGRPDAQTLEEMRGLGYTGD